MSNPCGLWVHPRLGVGTVSRGISASGGWRCLPLLARRSAGARPGLTVASVSWACEGRHKAGTYRELTGLKERSVANPSRAGTRPECRHQVGEACCRRGGVAGAEPPHKGGPNRPDRPEQQWSVVSGQIRRLLCRKLERELTAAWLRPRGTRKFAPILGCVPG